MSYLMIKRRCVNALALAFATITALFALFILGWLLYTLFSHGFERLNWHVLTTITRSADGNGGLANAIVGSFLISLFAILIGSPIGIMVGIYLVEYHSNSKRAIIIRFILDILLGSPSIIIGLFIYEAYVTRMSHFSGWAGSFALSIMVIPIVARTTENVYDMVSTTLHESVYALGGSQWDVIKFIILRVIREGILTAILLAFARIFGEAAPLLFTALNNQFWSLDMNQPMANLPVTVFNYAMSPYQDWIQIAWTGALLMTISVLMINLFSRWLIKKSHIRS